MKWFSRRCLWMVAVVLGFLLAGEMEQFDQMSEIEYSHEREFVEARLYDHLKLVALFGSAIILRGLWTGSWIH